jgi:hypothetical protein
MTTENTTSVELVYLGKAPGAGAKWVDRYARREAFEALGKDDRRLVKAECFKAGKRSKVIGGVYSADVHLDEDNNVTTLWGGSLQFKTQLTHPLVPVLEAEHYGHEVQGKRDAQEKKLLATPTLQREMANLRSVYSRLGWAGKQAFEVALVGLLRKP